jgi:hypothetical protein
MLSEKLIPITSTCFDASGYFRGRAAFRYRSGRVVYRTIPVSLWQRFMEADSKGKFYRKHIRTFATENAHKVSWQPSSYVLPERVGVGPLRGLKTPEHPDCSTATVSQGRKFLCEVQPTK